MEAYSKDLRSRVLADSDRGLTTRVVATKYNVSESWVRRLKQRRRETGETTPRVPKRRGPRRAGISTPSNSGRPCRTVPMPPWLSCGSNSSSKSRSRRCGVP
jgi:hypothetical protein